MIIPSGVVVAYDPGRVFRIGMARAFHGLGWCKVKGHVILNAYRAHSCVGVAYLSSIILYSNFLGLSHAPHVLCERHPVSQVTS